MTMQPTQFEIQPSSGVPIYLQIVEQVQASLLGRRLQPGDLLPSVRQMAAELGVNPMTISKAYSRLEADGLVERIRGVGMAISSKQAIGKVGPVKQRLQELEPQIHSLIVRASQLGLTEAQVLDAVAKAFQKAP